MLRLLEILKNEEGFGHSLDLQQKYSDVRTGDCIPRTANTYVRLGYATMTDERGRKVSGRPEPERLEWDHNYGITLTDAGWVVANALRKLPITEKYSDTNGKFWMGWDTTLKLMPHLLILERNYARLSNSNPWQTTAATAGQPEIQGIDYYDNALHSIKGCKDVDLALEEYKYAGLIRQIETRVTPDDEPEKTFKITPAGRHFAQAITTAETLAFFKKYPIRAGVSRALRNLNPFLTL